MNNESGSYVIQKLREKFSHLNNHLSQADQEKLEKSFFSKSAHKLLKIGCYVIPGNYVNVLLFIADSHAFLTYLDATFSGRIKLKSYSPKRALITKIIGVNFTQV